MARSPSDSADLESPRPCRAQDELLLASFIEGDETMFAELARRYEQPLYAYICRFTGSPSDAPDLFQETFIHVFRNASGFRGASSFKTWLWAITTNLCRTHRRKSLKHTSAPLKSDPIDPRASGEEDCVERKEVGGRIADAVAKLPAEQKEVFLLRVYDDMSYREVADVLNRPLGTVKSQMRLALIKLRGLLRNLAEAYGVA